MQGDTSAWLKPFVDIVLTVAHDFNIFYFLSFSVYKGDIICDVEGSVSLVFKFAFPPFSAAPPFRVPIPKQHMQGKHTTTWPLSGLTWPDQSNACTEYAT